MTLYRLPFVMHEPSEESENKYMAEIPTLSGCRAWGDTAAEALENLQSVAAAFIESYKAKEDSLPAEIVDTALVTDDLRTLGEVLVAV